MVYCLDLNDADLIEKHGLKGIEYCQLPFEIYKLREVKTNPEFTTRILR
jgi:hypothetical protein